MRMPRSPRYPGVNRPVAFKDQPMAAGVFVPRAKEGLGQIEEVTRCTRVSEINEPAE